MLDALIDKLQERLQGTIKVKNKPAEKLKEVTLNFLIENNLDA